ncbi:MAG: hypothetical protein FJ252_06510 [Phycisphaerae bacterium]|nr:hypothetical protein [Phycisphaerae bacterium]
MHVALRRLAAGVQAARAGLAYGAMAEGWFAVAIAHRAGRLEGDLTALLLAMSVVSLGLFVFGVAMNDVLDRKQDRAVMTERPGRWLLSVQWLAALAMVSLLAALGAASQFGRSGMLLAGLAAGGIVAYNVLAKFIPAFGFVSLGAIGALHMLVPDQHPGVLLPFWFSMTFTAIVAGIVHRLRQKRPVATVRGMLVATALWAAWSSALIWWIAPQTRDPMIGFDHPREGILAAIILLIAFVTVSVAMRRSTSGSPRQADRFARLATLTQALMPSAWFLCMGRPGAAASFAGAALALALADTGVRTGLHLARPLDYQP